MKIESAIILECGGPGSGRHNEDEKIIQDKHITRKESQGHILVRKGKQYGIYYHIMKSPSGKTIRYEPAYYRDKIVFMDVNK